MHAQITLVGRLIADPETKFLDSGKSKTTLKVAVNHAGRKPEGQQYPNSDVYAAEIWGARGETACQYFKKGDHVFVTGRLEVTKGRDNGYFLNVRFAEWSFCGSRQSTGNEQGGGEPAADFDDLSSIPF